MFGVGHDHALSEMVSGWGTKHLLALLKGYVVIVLRNAVEFKAVHIYTLQRIRDGRRKPPAMRVVSGHIVAIASVVGNQGGLKCFDAGDNALLALM